MAFPRIEIYPRAQQPLTGDEDLVVSQGGVTRKTNTESIALLASGIASGIVNFPLASKPSPDLAAGTPVGINASGVLVACRADTPSTLPFIGFYIGGTDVQVRTSGIVTTSGLTAGSPYFVGNTGGVTATEPTTSGYGSQRVGTALTSTQLFVQAGLVIIIDA